MPRKTDGIEFEIHPRPTKGKDGKPLLAVLPQEGGFKGIRLGFDQPLQHKRAGAPKCKGARPHS